MIIDRKSPIPIYAQLREQIKFAIETGQWQPGNRMPTVRQYAGELMINLNTVRKVYGELEEEGYITTHQGKGTFVAGIPDRDSKNPERNKLLDDLLNNLIIQSYSLGFTTAEICERLKNKVGDEQPAQKNQIGEANHKIEVKLPD